MATFPAGSPNDPRDLPTTVGLVAVRLLWQTIRLPIVTLLVILEPLVRTILMGIATLGVLMCLFYEFLIRFPHFPFWQMLALSLGSALLLLPYYALIKLFSMR